ncbi:MAG: hypothetical protein AAGJ31_06880, partial [Verrucomicrobiota bacterium]
SSGGLFQSRAPTTAFPGASSDSGTLTISPTRQISEIQVSSDGSNRVDIEVFRIEGNGNRIRVTDAMLAGTYRTVSLAVGTSQQSERFVIEATKSASNQLASFVEVFTIRSRTVEDLVSGSQVPRQDIVQIRVPIVD